MIIISSSRSSNATFSITIIGIISPPEDFRLLLFYSGSSDREFLDPHTCVSLSLSLYMYNSYAYTMSISLSIYIYIYIYV